MCYEYSGNIVPCEERAVDGKTSCVATKQLLLL